MKLTPLELKVALVKTGFAKTLLEASSMGVTQLPDYTEMPEGDSIRYLESGWTSRESWRSNEHRIDRHGRWDEILHRVEYSVDCRFAYLRGMLWAVCEATDVREPVSYHEAKEFGEWWTKNYFVSRPHPDGVSSWLTWVEPDERWGLDASASDGAQEEDNNDV